MNTTQRLLEMEPRTRLRISEVIRLIRIHRIIVPTPAINTIMGLCDDGALERAPRLRKNSPHHIFEDSFLKWVKKMNENTTKPTLNDQVGTRNHPDTNKIRGAAAIKDPKKRDDAE